MTTDPVTAEAVEALLPCPFCGIALVEDRPGFRTCLYDHPENDCWLRGMTVNSEEPKRVAAWNRRSPHLTHMRASRPLYAAPPSQAVEIAKLEWTWDDSNRFHGWTAVVAVFPNMSWQVSDVHGEWRAYTPSGEDAMRFPSANAAKAICQADYEQRVRSVIRSALVPAPPPAARAELVHLRDALAEYDRKGDLYGLSNLLARVRALAALADRE